jgi:hypothetical protein
MSTAILFLWGVHHALKELDESGIHGTYFTRKSLHGRPFNFNHTFGKGARNSKPVRIHSAAALALERLADRRQSILAGRY